MVLTYGVVAEYGAGAPRLRPSAASSPSRNRARSVPSKASTDSSASSHSLVSTGCDRPAPGPPGPTSTVQAAPSTLPAAPASWPEHTSADGGFRLRYPPGWRVTESAGSGGVALSLLPPRGDGISVLATTEQPPAQAAPCQPV